METGQEHPGGGPARRRAVAAILASGFLATLGVALFSFVVPLASLDARISGAWLGSAFAGYYLAKLLAAPLGGLLSDRIGPRPLLAGAPLLGALAPLLYLAAPGAGGLYAVQFLLGLISGLHRPVALAALGSQAGNRDLSRYFAIQAMTFGLAVFAGPLMGGLLYLDRRPGPVLAAVAACMALAGLAAALLLPGGMRTVAQKEARREPEPGVSPAALLLAVGGRTLGLGFLAAFYPILLSTLLGRGLRVALLFALPGLATALALPAAQRFFRDASREGLTVGGMLLSAAAMFAMGLAGASWQFALAGAAMGLGSALSVPASMALTAALSPRRGRLFGAAQLVAGIGFLLGPLLGGRLLPSLHAVAPPLQLAALIGALCAVPLAGSALRVRGHFGRGPAAVLALLLAAVLAAPGLAVLDAARPAAERDGFYRFTDVAMGTIVHLTLEAESRQGAERAARRAMDAMHAIQADLDFRSPGGSIRRINEAAGGAWVKPSARAFALIGRALAISRESGGVFDPTVGALTTADFYYALAPSLADGKRDLVDYRKVELNPAEGAVRLRLPGMALDMGGIAKGTIIDASVRMLRKHGVKSGIVEAGGDLYCFGDRDWKVGIRHPRSRELHATVTLREKGICGSGDYQQFVTMERGGEAERRHHIIDPATLGSAHASIGTSVIADSAELADALATTVFIMGPDKGREFLLRHHPGAAAIWFDPDRSVARTDNFPR